uniref:Protein fem-1 homolog B n=3 Tax=Cacopsylla melanoneura TaxID=428564 RepID=A0A8D9EJB8_9HEMI
MTPGGSVSQLLKDSIYFAAKDGRAINIYTALEELSVSEIKQLLNETVIDYEGHKCTPLIIAARNGHDKVVKIIISKFEPNIEQEGSVKVDNYVIEGATALWCAASGGHLSVIKTLVHAGANVNHATKTQSTPLRAACYDGRLDIVKYLIEHGADFNITNHYNNSCLMIAAYKGHLEIVSYLLSQGADPNIRAHCGATAMHFAAENGHTFIVKDLLGSGALVLKNENGMTPLMSAAERTQAEVVEFLVGKSDITLEEKIDALELLGASFANDKENYCLTSAYKYLYKTMQLRYQDPNNIIRKPECEPIAAYQNWKETQTLEELEAIRNNPNALHMEGLAIRERVLGPNSPEVPHSLIFRGAVFADQIRFNRCIDLWLHALHLVQLNNSSVAKDLLRFAQVFSQMINLKLDLHFTLVEKVVAAAVLELQRNKERIGNPRPKDDMNLLKEEMEDNLLTSLYLLVILTKVLKEDVTGEEKYRIYKLVFSLNKLSIASRQQQSLLHLCVNYETPVDTFHTNDVCKFPCAATTKLLIRCGADVNAKDHQGNTPLHIIATYERAISDFQTLHSVIMDLTENGAHMDTVNNKGLTPIQATTTGVADLILRTLTKINLKCLAAKVITQNNITYKGMVPHDLESFIELHGTVGATRTHKANAQRSRDLCFNSL